MKKRVEVLLIAFVAMLVLVTSIIAAARIMEFTKTKKLAEQEKAERERIEKSYKIVNRAFLITARIPIGEYFPMGTSGNDYNINVSGYLLSKMYESRTGIILPYETIFDYFSEEFEPDGSLRLYDNGLHPEIEAYVEWANGCYVEMHKFIDDIHEYYSIYSHVHSSNGFEYQYFYSLSPQMLDELVKKEADPDYEMDLLSLQQQGY